MLNSWQNTRSVYRYFPGGPVVKNLPCNAGDVGLISGRGTEVPHATEQLGLRAAAPVSHRPHLESPCAQGRTPRAATETQHSRKKRDQYTKVSCTALH